MTLLSPSSHTRLNEAVGFLFFLLGLAISLSLISYSATDPSWNTATALAHTHNLLGLFGARWADLLFQIFGVSVFLLPVHIWLLGWKWVRSSPIESPWFRVLGASALWFCVSTACGLIPRPWLIAGVVRPSGIVGMVMADFLLARFDLAGAAIITVAAGIIALYFASTFEVSTLMRWLRRPIAKVRAIRASWRNSRELRRQRVIEKAKAKAAERAARRNAGRTAPDNPAPEQPPFEPDSGTASEPQPQEIPIRTLEYQPAIRTQTPEEETDEMPPFEAAVSRTPIKRKRQYRLPSTELLNEVSAANGYDGLELKAIAGRIKSKLEEFNVRGSVVQINPGPVVTTFEYKPEAGIKYSRITTLNEDLCLGLQAESILIERLPGKPTVGIEVPNTRRELISLRAILESEEFHDAPSKMTIALGKDINGRIKVTSLESMPHLLIAGSTGSGKSVMLNAMIMSFLYKATPDEVRMIMVDPKRVELGIYEGIPHLLTPVITEPKKATNALRNAVLEMERRLKLLASQGVRNIDQYNRKIAQFQQKPRNLFDEPDDEENLEPLPYVLILIDELADLMMLERANVEECITRLAQMARAVGMHLVLATQRPSVDVITGLIKANFPSRISFRVATRVDSRTVLDVMGAEHLLGKGDMLFLPPGSSRLTRVHGAFVTEAETNRVVDFWKEQAEPEYDESFLLAPPSEEDEEDADAFDGEQDPMYQDAVRVVVEMGKASTSTLQRRLRLGYGRAARILDVMQRDGIIGPPDGSKPREVLKRPDWLREVQGQLR
ncbi:MAG: DNA translocase FtsK 4TM domain-containing protein [Acidobacteriaceae bacterium]|nr:DNA translocase FtsK 4TM domain-containing protein [Acidobacteriaceae bacterium]MBV9764305.1 DNA translocase FtsK 4TM domain-containing protein [Acidobacteriaceae bacterium]